MDYQVLERRGEPLTLYLKNEVLIPCPPSLHQPAMSRHTWFLFPGKE